MSYTYEELKAFVKKVRPYVESVEVMCGHLGIDSVHYVRLFFHSEETCDALMVGAPQPYNEPGRSCVVAYQIPYPMPEHLIPLVLPTTTETTYTLQLLARIKEDL